MAGKEWECPVCYNINSTMNLKTAVCADCGFRAFPFFSNTSEWNLFRKKIEELEKTIDQAQTRVDNIQKSPSVNSNLNFLVKHHLAKEAHTKIFALLNDCSYKQSILTSLHRRIEPVLEEYAFKKSENEKKIDEEFKEAFQIINDTGGDVVESTFIDKTLVNLTK